MGFPYLNKGCTTAVYKYFVNELREKNTSVCLECFLLFFLFHSHTDWIAHPITKSYSQVWRSLAICTRLRMQVTINNINLFLNFIFHFLFTTFVCLQSLPEYDIILSLAVMLASYWNTTRSCYSNLKPRLYFWLINSFLSQKLRLNLICLHYE